VITNELIEDYINCQYKAIRKLNNEIGKKSEYENTLKEIYSFRKQEYFNNISAKFNNRLYYYVNHKKKYCNQFPYWIKNPIIQENGIIIKIDAFEVVKTKNKLVEFIPILVVPSEKIYSMDRLYIYVICKYFTKCLQLNFKYARIIYGKALKTSKIKLQQYIDEGDKIYNGLNGLSISQENQFLFKKQHCQICEFMIKCHTILIEKDDLSLLGRISQKEIKKLNNTGIFTIKQLSYKFRPKKRKPPKQTERNLYALKSLAIRENEIFVISKPDFPEVQYQIFIDFESLPEENYIYLIGLILWDGKKTVNKYFWADSKEFEENIFKEFFNFLLKFENFVLYHFGNFEIKELQKLNKKFENKYNQTISQITSQAINILSYFRTHIFPPTYSNSLKGIAAFINFKWSSENANGLTCVAWRKQWEINNKEALKKQIVKYNQDDCKALWLIHIWLNNINNENVTNVKDIPSVTLHKFGNLNSIVENFNKINNYAWFDYQRSKIYLRTNPKIKEIFNSNNRNSRNTKNKICKTILIDNREECPKCKYIKPYKREIKKRIIIDLKVMTNGIKKITIQYLGRQFKCPVCNKTFFPKAYNGIGRYRYGHNLKSWCTNLHINHRISLRGISEILKENFDINVFPNIVYDFKRDISQMSITTFEDIKREIISGNLIHVDETKINLRKESGFVFAFSNMETVFYIYKSTRETKFLFELLEDFKGVLISDFYTGYDSLKCNQQKCLVHLIRDLNDDLLKNQFDEEFKLLVFGFSELLNKIVETIDKYGLKKRNLSKHIKDVARFYKKFIFINISTEIGEKYQKRFKKYRDKLFTFLNYDNIPWNNNNVEHAFKHFAMFRNNSSGHHTLKGINETLLLMSIYQTCKYRNLSFLNFLYSKENRISDFQEKYNTKGKLKKKYTVGVKLKKTNI